MNIIKLDDLELKQVGTEIQLVGALYADQSILYIVPLPDEDVAGMLVKTCNCVETGTSLLSMNEKDWEKFLRQSDLQEVETNQDGRKAIIRKSQRVISQFVSWNVFRRDGYCCRYCGRDNVPLTVDHVDLWEDGGASVEENLVTACKRCNKARGRTPYAEWIESESYGRLRCELPHAADRLNCALVDKLSYLKSLRVSKQRSR
jgi:hypothetical protein